METTEFSIVGPHDLIKDLIKELPAKGPDISVVERPPPSSLKSGAAAEPIALALLGAHLIVAIAVFSELGKMMAKRIRRWLCDPAKQQNRECELLIHNRSGEEHRIKFTVAMSEDEIAETLRDFTE